MTLPGKGEGGGIVLDAGSARPFAEIDRILPLLEARRPARAGSLWGSSQAFVLAALSSRLDRPFLVAASTDAEAQAFVEDLAAFGAPAAWLPAREEGSGLHETPDAETLRMRLAVAQRLAGPAEHRPRIVVASVLSLLRCRRAPTPTARR